MPKLNPKRSKKAIKAPDEFLTFSQRVMVYVRSHKKQVYGIIVGILAAAAIYTTGWAYWNFMNKKASLLYGNATTRFNSVINDQEKFKSESESIQKMLEDVYNRYPLSKPARLIYPFLGYINFSIGNLDKAANDFQKFSEKFKGSEEFFILSRIALSKCLEQKGDIEGAYNILKEFSLDETYPISATLTYQKIRLLSMKQGDEKAAEEVKSLAQTLKQNWPDYPMLPVIEAKLIQ